MTQLFRPTLEPREMAVQVGPINLNSFDYTPLAAEVARRVQAAAQRIRRLMERTLLDVIAVGQELQTVKETLPHGQFSVWLRAEFDWTQRTAGRFMAVAQRFGSTTDTGCILKIDLTAAYLLASPSAPEEASAVALQRAQSGERITPSIAKRILGSYQSKPERQQKASAALACPTGKLRGQLLEVLESFRRQWDPREVAILARQLRDFADSLDEK